MQDETESPKFLVPLPGGRVARVPLQVLEAHVVAGAASVHATLAPTTLASAENGTKHGISDRTEATEDRSVAAHSMSPDTTTGTASWHTDWEFGECETIDESGFPQRLQAWHRHPFGTEYAELFEGR